VLPILRVILVTFLVGPLASAATRSLELRGQVDPPPKRARVTLEAAASAFTATTTVDSKGRFRFRKLSPGPYMIIVVQPGIGVTGRSIDVTPGLADANGLVEAIIPFSPSAISAPRPQRRNTVSVSELAIPDRARHEFTEAQKLHRKQDIQGAIKHLKKALDLAPQFTLAWNELGTIAYRARNWMEAESCFRKVLDLRPGTLTPILNLGGVLLYSGNYRDALQYNQLAVERSSRHPLANFQLGLNYVTLGLDEEGLKYLKIAKEIDPSHYASPHLPIADVYLRRGDPIAALAELEEYLTRHPDAPNAATIRDLATRLKR
jgi:tetratricopeptide (TPR) repeat protein